MYRVIVIEDEDIIRKGLVYSIPWQDMDCSVVGEARNGIEGISLIEEKKPDIILVDINMPIMNGLDMLEATYETYDYAAIILSGYSDFEYAREAIRFGVTGYLLKPLKRDEIRSTVEDAKKKCAMKRAYNGKRQRKEDWKQISVLSNYPATTTDPVVQEMLQYVFNHYQEKILMQDIVEAMNYSETFLNKKFKKHVGTTFIEYLNRYRLQKAIELLQKGTAAVQDISWMCGIGDYKYFSTVFKKYIGCSPKDYLENIRN